MKRSILHATVVNAAILLVAAATTATPRCPELPLIEDNAPADQVARAVDRLTEPTTNLGSDCPEARIFATDLVDRALRIGDFDRAVRICVRLSKGLDGVPREGRMPCARANAFVGNIPEATSLLDACVLDAGEDRGARVRTLVSAARILEERYRFEAAATFLGRAVDESPDDRDLAIRWVDALLESGQVAKAGVAASKVVKQQPGLLRELAKRLVQRGATSNATALAGMLVHTGAREDLDTAVAIHMGNKDRKAAIDVVRAFVATGDDGTRLDRARTAAEVMDRHGMAREASELFARTIGAQAGAEASDLELLGSLMLRGGRIDDAGTVLAKAFEASGRTTDAGLRIADLWARAQKPRRAADVLRQVDEPSIDRAVDLTLRAGRYLRDAGDPAAEDAWYQEVASRIADPAALWQAVGEALNRAGEPVRALAAFEAASSTAADPRRVALANIGRAEALLAKGRGGREAAEAALRQALEGAADDPALVNRIESAARRLPDSTALSRWVLTASLQRDSSRYDLWVRLAEVEASNGQTEAAIDAFGHAIDTAPVPSEVLSAAIDRLAGAGMAGAAIRLLQTRANGIRLSPTLSERVAMICLRLGENECARRHAAAFLEGPLDTEYDYVTLARQLADRSLDELAEQALVAAKKRLPPAAGWMVALELGRLEVLRGREDRAEEWFERAASEGEVQEVSLLVARTWRAVGSMARAVTWYERAAATGDAVAILPELLDAYGRSGRRKSVADRVATIPDNAWQSARRVIPVVASLITQGLSEPARSLIDTAFATMPLTEHPGLEPLRVLLALGSDPKILERTREGCLGAQGAGERSCELLASGLAARGLGDQAVSVLLAVSEGRPDAQSARTTLAEILLRLGNVDAASAIAVEIAADATASDEVRARLARLFHPQRWPREASGVLEALYEHASGEPTPGVVRESVRLLIRQGRTDAAINRLASWVATSQHRRFDAYRILVRAGLRDHALTFVRPADAEAIGDTEPRIIAAVLADLLEHGERPLVEEMLARVEHDGNAARLETLANALSSVAWDHQAARMLNRIPVADRSAQASVERARLLLKFGEKDEALALFEAAAVGTEPIRPEVREAMIRSLMIEGTPVARTARLAASPPGKDDDVRLSLWQARMLAGGPDDALVEGRELFLRHVQSVDTLPPEGSDYIRTEARRGSLGTLLPRLDGLPGLPARQAFLYAACLMGDTKSVSRARARLEEMDGATGYAGRLASARAWFECGHWAPAQEAAESALERMGPDRDPREAAALAVVAGRLAGKDRAPWVLRQLRARTDDRLVNAEQAASIYLVRGDTSGAALAMASRAEETPGDERVWLAVARLAVQAGDDKLRIRAQERAIQMPIDMASTLQGFEDGYREALREDLAGQIVDITAGWYPQDARIVERRFNTSLQAGDDARAAEASVRFLDLVGDRRAAAVFVVSRAAAMLSVPVVDRFLDEALDGPPDEAAARAALQAALLRFRTGREAEGFALLDRAGHLSTDPVGLISSVGRAAVSDPWLTPAAVDRVIDALRSAGYPNPEALGRIPCALAATCLGRTEADGVEDCAQLLDQAGFQPIPLLIGAGKRAFALHRYDIGEAAFHAAARRDTSRMFGRALAIEIMEAVGDRYEVRDQAIRSRLGAFALSRMDWRGAAIDPEGLSLVSQLTELASGPDAAVALARRDLAINPADASGWNSLAYMLSMSGAHMEDALRYIRTAELLEPAQNGYFQETEAWTHFRLGDVRAAIGPQEQASRLWTAELGSALAESLNHLGQILEAVGRRDAAIVAYRQAFIRGPETSHGRRALARWHILTAPAAN